MNKAFLLDRDGTINVDTGYVGNPDDVVLLPGVAEAIRRMNEAGYLVIVVSNQSGVARGYFPLENVDLVNRRINALLGEVGAHIDAFYICPHLKGAPLPEYDMDCACRKPKDGLFRQAIAEHDIQVEASFACGDKPRDVACLPALGFLPEHLAVVDGDNGLLSFVRRVLTE